MTMEKVNPPYRASFSTSNAVVMALTSLCFKVGRLSAVSAPVPLLAASANEAAAYLEEGGKRLTPSQLRGLYRGEDIASVPLARRICSLFYKSAKIDPGDSSFLKTYESTLWGEDIPVRLSRRVDSYPYSIPPHAKVEELLNRTFIFVKNAQPHVSPILLSGLLLFMLPAIMPYREHPFLLAFLYAKAELIRFKKDLLGIKLLKHLYKNENKLKSAYEKSVGKEDMAPFLIAYMQAIEEAIEESIKHSLLLRGGLTPMAKRMLEKMEPGKFYSATDLLSLLGLKSRLGLHKNYLKPALEANKIEMSNPLSPTDRNQRYRKKP